MSKPSKSKSTNKDQYSRLVDLLEEQPDIAKGFAKCNASPYWNSVAAELNSLGPPTKDSTAWKKVWFDWKSNTKRKLAHNRREQFATGGGPSKFIELTALEERVVVLAGLAPAVEGIADTCSFGLEPSANQSIHDSGESASIEDNRIPEDRANENNETHTSKKRRTSMHTLLETQVQNQATFHDSVTNILKCFEKKLLIWFIITDRFRNS
ncbi:uncharacterized protein LOC129778416 [Toxorhynchites rutilus septentrionalis]|uniref:uncharacterized protein LOC129778416 n=1 Tax=Toxorhynchites rutilus septentrionalis TaxID=329112 RepID=UPI002479CA04|nr:uncharacterized protein LOC129778416 [Toxorhynchites rutilus septentrionalis]